MEVAGKDIQNFQATVRSHSTYNFSQYSINSLRRRLTRILLELDMNMETMCSHMQDDAVFMDQIIHKVTVHTTELFRDPQIWIHLKKELLPSLSGKERIRIWHPGCSTGQEVYSMLMVLDQLNLLERSEVYGSDLHEEILDLARLGTYKYHFNQSYLENFDRVMMDGNGVLSRENKKNWKKYFQIDETRDRIQMKLELRQKAVYKKMDLAQDDNPFLVNFDLIVCRNVIIYFNTDLQDRVFELFHHNLSDGGALLLGVHESIMGPYSKRFLKRSPFYFKAEE